MSTVAIRTDDQLVHAIRRGEEDAFAVLVNRYWASLLRLAMVYVESRSVAEEVVRETWLGALHRLERFEVRSSLKTWVFRILVDRARERAAREGRSFSFSTLVGGDEHSVEPEHFLDASHGNLAGHWAVLPSSWDAISEERLHAKETLSHVQRVIETLPPAERVVITLRDVESWPSEDVCALLDVSETSQRMLLQRARSKVRQALEELLSTAATAMPSRDPRVVRPV